VHRKELPVRTRTLFGAAIVLAVLAASPSLSVYAADPATVPAAVDKNPHLWKPRTTAVSVFKNGMGFFVREGEVELRDGWAVAEEVPPAAFGTLAVYSHNEKELVDMVGSGPGEVVEFDDIDAPLNPAAKRARLDASKNLKLQLSYKQGGADRTASGKLVSVGPEFAVLERDGTNFAVPVEGVTKLQVLELPLRVHVSADDAKAVTKTKIGMAYLRKGVTWVPEYTLQVLDDKTAELTLRGTFVNEAEDLFHADVNFVVGVPNFAHSDFLAPLAIGQVIRTIGAAVGPREFQSQMMNSVAITNNATASPQLGALPADVIERPVGGTGREPLAGSLPQLGGAAATDFTTYTKKDVTLRRGEKMIVTLLVKKIRYGHIYRWEAPVAMKHALVLFNDTDTAWTTGPVLAMSKKQPLSEDLLKYTPKEGRCEIPVTTSINVAHELATSETARKLKAYSPNSDRYFLDLVTLEGKLTLRNFEKDTIDVIITTPVPGKPLEASDGGIVTSDPGNLVLRERTGNIGWTLKLKPGETKTLTYTFERYVPSN